MLTSGRSSSAFIRTAAGVVRVAPSLEFAREIARTLAKIREDLNVPEKSKRSLLWMSELEAALALTIATRAVDQIQVKRLADYWKNGADLDKVPSRIHRVRLFVEARPGVSYGGYFSPSNARIVINITPELALMEEHEAYASFAKTVEHEVRHAFDWAYFGGNEPSLVDLRNLQTGLVERNTHGDRLKTQTTEFDRTRGVTHPHLEEILWSSIHNDKWWRVYLSQPTEQASWAGNVARGAQLTPYASGRVISQAIRDFKVSVVELVEGRKVVRMEPILTYIPDKDRQRFFQMVLAAADQAENPNPSRSRLQPAKTPEHTRTEIERSTVLTARSIPDELILALIKMAWLRNLAGDEDAPETWQEWLHANHPMNVAMVIENDYDIYKKYLTRLPKNIIGEYPNMTELVRRVQNSTASRVTAGRVVHSQLSIPETTPAFTVPPATSAPSAPAAFAPAPEAAPEPEPTEAVELLKAGYQTYKGTLPNGKSVRVRCEHVVERGSYPGGTRQRRIPQWMVHVNDTLKGEFDTLKEARAFVNSLAAKVTAKTAEAPDTNVTELKLEGKAREEKLPAVFDMMVSTYAKLGAMNMSDPSELLEADVWYVWEVGGKPVAFSLMKKTPYGLKMISGGTDGSLVGKGTLKAKTVEQSNTPGVYAEVSHAMAKLTQNAPYVRTSDVGRVLGKDVKVVDDSQYSRHIKGVGEVVKRMVGRPLGVEVVDPAKPAAAGPAPISETSKQAQQRVAQEQADLEDKLDSWAHASCQVEHEDAP